MRLNVKRFMLAIVACVLLWLAFTFLSFEMPSLRSARRTVDKARLETRVHQLEKSVSRELNESTKLLKQLREKLQRRWSTQRNQHVIQAPSQPVLPILVIACNRVSVNRCLDKLVKYRPSVDTFPIIISQDCNHNATYQVIQSYATPGSGITVVQQPDQSDIGLPLSKRKFQGYYKISRHYKFALSHVLDTLRYESVVIVEDDLDIAEDFYEYFLGTYPLLKKDTSLWCISAWNDNGKKGLIDPSQPELLHRTDFFPGLGWLLPARVWKELKHKWPPAFFDDWLREPEQTGGRSCIRPEISRTSTFGKEGVSKGLFFDLHLRYIQLSDQFIPFTQLDLSYLLKDDYDRRLHRVVRNAEEMTVEDVVRGRYPHPLTVEDMERTGSVVPSVRITYSDRQEFKQCARKLGLMDDFRSGVPRTAYRGIVSCFYKKRRVYIVPAARFTKYDPTWS